MSAPSVIYDYDPNKLPSEYLQAIGLAIASAAQTESVLSMAMAACLGVDHTYMLALTPHMAIPLKLSVARSASHLRLKPAAQKEFEKLLAAVQDALGARNKYAHDSWCMDPQTRQVFRNSHSARVKVELKLHPTTVNEIKADAFRIHKVGMNLMTFLIVHKLF